MSDTSHQQEHERVEPQQVPQESQQDEQAQDAQQAERAQDSQEARESEARAAEAQEAHAGAEAAGDPRADAGADGKPNAGAGAGAVAADGSEAVSGIDVAPLEQLIGIRQEQMRLDGFRERAGRLQEQVDALVFQRVLEDYARRNTALEQRAAPLKAQAVGEYRKLQASQARVQALHENARLAREELQFRQAVGELDEGGLAEQLREPDETLARCRAEQGAIDALKARFIEAFGTEEALTSAASASAFPSPSAPASASAAGASGADAGRLTSETWAGAASAAAAASQEVGADANAARDAGAFARDAALREAASHAGGGAGEEAAAAGMGTGAGAGVRGAQHADVAGGSPAEQDRSAWRGAEAGADAHGVDAAGDVGVAAAASVQAQADHASANASADAVANAGARDVVGKDAVGEDAVEEESHGAAVKSARRGAPRGAGASDPKPADSGSFRPIFIEASGDELDTAFVSENGSAGASASASGSSSGSDSDSESNSEADSNASASSSASSDADAEASAANRSGLGAGLAFWTSGWGKRRSSGSGQAPGGGDAPPVREDRTNIFMPPEGFADAPPAGGAAQDASPSHTVMMTAAVLIGATDVGGQSARHSLGLNTSVGRSEDNSLRLINPSVSRQHARLTATPDGYVVEDLRSQNGTFVNGERIEKHALRDGDELVFGDAVFTFRAFAPGAQPSDDLAGSGGAASSSGSSPAGRSVGAGSQRTK